MKLRLGVTFIALALVFFFANGAVLASPGASAVAPEAWGALKTWDGVTTTYAVYQRTEAYASPFLITDTRSGDQYTGKESFDMHTLTIYRPASPGLLLEHRPVVFFVHGGGWVDGYASWYDFVAQSFTGEQGWVTVVADYRLTSDQVFLADPGCPDVATCNANSATRVKAAWYPDDLQDVAAALQWTAANIGGNGGNANQIVVSGHSAGGHLVSLLATHPDYAASLRPAIRAVISTSGAYDMSALVDQPLTYGDLLRQTFTGGFANNDTRLSEASPSTYIQAGAHLPPFYVLHCELDMPGFAEQASEFESKLAAQGFAVASSYLAGYNHYSEMDAMRDINAAPTALIASYIESILDLAHPKVYLPLAKR